MRQQDRRIYAIWNDAHLDLGMSQKLQPQICSGCPLPTKALVAACWLHRRTSIETLLQEAGIDMHKRQLASSQVKILNGKIPDKWRIFQRTMCEKTRG